MKCKSCEAEINPQWKYAIDSNICPFCGKSVMDEVLKNLFSTLRETIDSATEYKSQLDDWMLSNYGYIKSDSPDLINHLPMEQLDEYMKSKHSEKYINNPDSKKYTVKVQTDNGEEEIAAEKTQSEEKTNDFFKRAEAVKPNIDGFKSASEKTQHLKNLAQQIKRVGSLTMNNSMIDPAMLEQADPDAVSEMQSLMSMGPEISSSLQNSDGDDDIPSVVLAMADQAQGRPNQQQANAADLLKLKQMQDRNNNSRKNFESGENRGKGGFSRA